MKFRLNVKFESPFYPVCGVTLRDCEFCPMPVVSVVSRDVHDRFWEVAAIGFDVDAERFDVLSEHMKPESNARRLRVRFNDRRDETSFM